MRSGSQPAKQRSLDLPARFQAAAHRHMEHCREALARMQTGWAMVGSHAIARRAFQLANQAMLYQQVRSRLPLREVERGTRRRTPSGRPSPRRRASSPGRGNWRPFQIAFILASLPELVDPAAQNAPSST